MPGLQFEVSDLLKLSYRDSFDVVTSARVLQWVNNPLDALRSMVRSIESGGKLIVLDYNHHKNQMGTICRFKYGKIL